MVSVVASKLRTMLEVLSFAEVWSHARAGQTEVRVRGEVQKLTGEWFELVDVSTTPHPDMPAIRTRVPKSIAPAGLTDGTRIDVTGRLNLDRRSLSYILWANAASVVTGAAKLTPHAQLAAARKALGGTHAGEQLKARKPAPPVIPRSVRAESLRVRWIAPLSTTAFDDAYRDGQDVGYKTASTTQVSFTDADALAKAVREPTDADVVVLLRGGGDWRQWIPLNSPALIAAVANSSVPVITAIGHLNDAPAVTRVAAANFQTPTAVRGALIKHAKAPAEARARAAELKRHQDAQAAAQVAEEQQATALRQTQADRDVAYRERNAARADHRAAMNAHARDLRTLALLRITVRSILLALASAALMTAAPFVSLMLATVPIHARWWGPACGLLFLTAWAAGTTCLIGLTRARKRATTPPRRPKAPSPAESTVAWTTAMRSVRTPRAYRALHGPTGTTDVATSR